MSASKFLYELGQPPQVDDQGSLETCVRFALSKAIVDGFEKGMWVESKSVDIEQNTVTSILLNEHKDGQRKSPIDFNGKTYQFQDLKNIYWLTKLEVKESNRIHFVKDINQPKPMHTYVLGYQDPSDGPHCVYITRYDADTNTLECMNSHGAINQHPIIPINQVKNIIFQIECTASEMTLSSETAYSPVGPAKESAQVKHGSSELPKKQKDAESVIGSECFHLLLEAANNGKISDETMEDLAKKMEPRVYGEYKKKSVIKNIDTKAVLKSMLNKWFDVFLFKLNDGEGQAKLLGILDGLHDCDEMVKLACEMRTSLKHQEK